MSIAQDEAEQKYPLGDESYSRSNNAMLDIARQNARQEDRQEGYFAGRTAGPVPDEIEAAAHYLSQYQKGYYEHVRWNDLLDVEQEMFRGIAEGVLESAREEVEER